jgi:hypothetical protein
VGRIELGEDARTFLQGRPFGDTGGDASRALESHGFRKEAVSLQAVLLDNRDAVAWSIACCRRALGEKAGEKEKAALDAAGKWVDEPTAENGRQAEECAKALHNQGPAAFAALAAFWSGHNLAPEGLPAVDVPPGLAARGVAASVLLSAGLLGLERIPETLSEFLALSHEIAGGKRPAGEAA